MEIRKFAVAPHDLEGADRAFAQTPAEAIACCNWPGEFPYAPSVRFRMFHSGDRLWVRFEVEERYTAARTTEDNGRVWTDSCVEFFLSPDGEGYYNFETTCIGKLLLAHRRSRKVDVVHAPQEVLSLVERYPSLPSEPFEEREGDNRWSLTLAIPPEALFRHDLKSWDGVGLRVNLYKCGDELSHPHFLSWKPIQTEHPDFHRPEFFTPIELQ